MSWRVALWGLSWIPVAATFTQTVGQAVWIKGSSMQPTLNPDASLGRRDFVLLQKWGIHKLNVGDVVVLKSPMDPNRVLVKRVLGVGGQTVRPRPTSTYPKPEVKLLPGHIWVEGDNIHSIDSNDFGPVSSGLVIGKACFIVMPFYRWGPIQNGGRSAVVEQ